VALAAAATLLALGAAAERLAPGGIVPGSPTATHPVRDLDAAGAAATRFADALDLEVARVMRFDNDFYVQLSDERGRPATELLVDPQTGAVWFEPGAATVWNARFGSLTPGAWTIRADAPPKGDLAAMPSRVAPEPVAPLLPEDAAARARAWLSTRSADVHVAGTARFPGYYTLLLGREGRITGMLSVNATSGEVWYHSWHGAFRGMSGAPPRPEPTE
jgi:hypothetical protein